MKIFLIDDSSTFLLHMKTILLNIEGIEVDTYKDPIHALDEIDEVIPDIVITDFEMPGINGDELCLKIRNNEKFLTTPILMLTSKDGDEAYLKAMKAGADDFLCKSSSEEVITTKVQTMMRKVSWLNKDIQSKQLEAIKALIVLTNHEFNNALTIANGFLGKIKKNHQEINPDHLKKVEASLSNIRTVVDKLTDMENFNNESYVGETRMLKLKDEKK
ncbi:MAG: response regulator [Oligoflexia bacterium]|nr:response regulator [Oligoflexia bacterium]